mgnify:CR=1 FL=1
MGVEVRVTTILLAKEEASSELLVSFVLIDFDSRTRARTLFRNRTLKHVKDEDGKHMLSDVSGDALTKKRTAAITETKQRHFFRVTEAARRYCIENR